MRVVEYIVVECDVVPLAELLELFAGQFSIVQHNALRGSIMHQILPQVFCDLCGVFCVEEQESGKLMIMICHHENIAVTLSSCYHVCEIYPYSFHWLGNWRKLFSVLL